MPRARIDARHTRKLLALTYESKLGLRDVSSLTGVSKTTIREYLVRFRRTGISYSGETLPYYLHGEQRRAEIYVAVLGASQLAYVEAAESLKQESFVRPLFDDFAEYYPTTILAARALRCSRPRIMLGQKRLRQ